MLLDEVGNNWPLIRFLLDDPEYAARYHQALQDVLDNAYIQDSLYQRMDAYHALVAPYVANEIAPYTHLRNQAEFTDSLTLGADALTRVVLGGRRIGENDRCPTGGLAPCRCQ